MKNLSTHIYFVRCTLARAAHLPGQPESLLRKSRIPKELVDNGNVRISLEQQAKLQLNTALALNDEFLRSLTKPIPFGSIRAAGLLAVDAKTLVQAIRRLCRHYNSLQNDLKFELAEHNNHYQFSLIPAGDFQASMYLTEFVFFGLHRFCSWLIGKSVRIERVSVSHEQPSHSAEYRHMFFGAPVRYSDQDNVIVLEKDSLRSPVTRNREDLKFFLKNPFRVFLTNPLKDDSLITRVKQVIGSELDQIPRMEDVAEKLAMHPQKLYRLLREESLSYVDIKNELRRDTAIYYLSKPDFSIEDIAEKTGFSEASAFIRAFKQWTGVTPNTYKKKITIN